MVKITLYTQFSFLNLISYYMFTMSKKNYKMALRVYKNKSYYLTTRKYKS